MGDDHRHRCIELASPVDPRMFAVAELARMRHPGEVARPIAGADRVQRRARIALSIT